MSPRLTAALVAAVTCWTSPASALGTPNVYDNYSTIPIGSRAAGMGGAYTALACDEAALHYNVASLSCAASSHLELTANAYVVQGLFARGELGPGKDISATTFHSIPSIVGAVRVLREGSARTRFATYPGRLSFGFTVSVPSSVMIKIDPPNPSARNFASSSVRDDLTAGDLGLAYQINREIAVGVSLGAVMRTADQNYSWLLVRGPGSACPASRDCGAFVSYDASRSYLAIGLRAKAGLLVRPIKNFSFGLALTTPTLHVLGSAKESATVTRAHAQGYGAVPLRATGTSEVGLPLRLAAGMAYVKKRYTFTGDLSINFPRQVRFARDMTAQPIEGLSLAAVERTLDPTFQPNVALGASVPFGPEKELNIGFFTDFSSVSPADVARGSDRIHMVGGSMTLGLLGKQSRVWVGTSGEVGHTTTRVPGRAFAYDSVNVPGLPTDRLPVGGDATLVRWTLVGILGSNYAFLE